MKFRLGVLLVVGAAGEGRIPEPCLVRVGMKYSEAQAMLGNRAYERIGALLGGVTISSAIRRDDWMGGRQEWSIFVKGNDRIEKCSLRYEPFAEAPPGWTRSTQPSAPDLSPDPHSRAGEGAVE